MIEQSPNGLNGEDAFRPAAPLADASPRGMATHYLLRDPRGEPVDAVFLDVNQAYLALMDLDRQRCQGQRGSAVLPPAVDGALLAAYGRAVNQQCTVELELDLPASFRRVQVTAFPNGPEVVGSVVTEVGGERLFPGQLSAVAAAVELSDDLVLIADAAGYIQYANAAWVALTGFTREETLRQPIVEFLSPPASPPRSDGQRGGLATLRTVDGADVRVWSSVTALRDEVGRATHQVVMAASIARQPGSARSAAGRSQRWPALDGLLLTAPETSPTPEGRLLDRDLLLAQYLRQMEQSVARTRAWLAQCHHGPDLALVSPNRLLLDLRTKLGRLLGDGIGLELELHFGVADILVDRDHLERIVLHLAANARDAMGRHGTLVLATSVAKDGVEAQSMVRLTVRDDGHGMDRATQLGAFDPYHAGQPGGEGRGLGLATVQVLVAQNHGRIACKSQPGFGTRVTVDFPAAELPTGGQASMNGSTRRILVIEEDPTVLRLAAQALELAHFDVVAVGSAAAALQIELEPALAILDPAIGDGGGLAVAERLVRRWPRLRLLFVHGPGLHTVEDVRLTGKPTGLLKKPYSAGQLRAKVGEVLGAEPPSDADASGLDPS